MTQSASDSFVALIEQDKRREAIQYAMGLDAPLALLTIALHSTSARVVSTALQALNGLAPATQTPAPIDLAHALLSRLQQHPILTGRSSRGPWHNTWQSLPRTCALWRVEEAHELLCQCIETPYPTTPDNAPERALRRAIWTGLRRFGPHQRTIDACQLIAKTPEHPYRKEAIALCLHWQIPTMAGIETLLTMALQTSNHSRWTTRRAHELARRQFNFQNKEHLRILQQIHQDLPDPMLFNNNVPPTGLHHTKALGFLGANAPQDIQWSLYQGQRNQALSQMLSGIFGPISDSLSARRNQAYMMSRGVQRHLQQATINDPLVAHIIQTHHQPKPEYKRWYTRQRRLHDEHTHGDDIHSIAPTPKSNKPWGFGAPVEPRRLFPPQEREHIHRGQRLARKRFRHNHNDATRMSALRELLSNPINHATWSAVCTFLELWCQHRSFPADIVYHYVNDHMQQWPDGLRLAPRKWWNLSTPPDPTKPWPIIRRIDLGDNTKLSHRNKPNLEQLQRNIGTAPSISHCTQLLVQHCHMDEVTCIALLQYIPQCQLQYLQLDGNQLSQRTLQRIVELPHLQSLTHLSLRFNNIQRLDETQIKRQLPHLQEIIW